MTPKQIERLADVAEFWASKLATEPAATERLQAEHYGRAQGYRQMAEVLRSEAMALLWCDNAERHGFEACR